MTASPSKGACGAKVHREGFIAKSYSSVEEGASGSYSCMELLDIAATNVYQGARCKTEPFGQG